MKCYKTFLVYIIHVTLHYKEPTWVILWTHYPLRILLNEMFYLWFYNNGSSRELLPCSVYLPSRGLNLSIYKTLFYRGTNTSWVWARGRCNYLICYGCLLVMSFGRTYYGFIDRDWHLVPMCSRIWNISYFGCFYVCQLIDPMLCWLQLCDGILLRCSGLNMMMLVYIYIAKFRSNFVGKVW